MDKITPTQLSLSLSHFTDVWDPHVNAFFNLTSPLQEMRAGSGVQQREP
jgi:hypothetical protein